MIFCTFILKSTFIITQNYSKTYTINKKTMNPEL